MFATVAMAIATDREVVIAGVTSEWNMSYSQLIPFSITDFIAFFARYRAERRC